MKQTHTGEYPHDWQVIAQQIKDRAGWKCARCGHEHNTAAGYMLTVHHADCNKSNLAWWNLLPLCQRCHLHIQGKVIMRRQWLFEHSDWFKPFAAGYYAHIHGLDDSRDAVMANLQRYLDIGQHREVA